MKRAIFLSVLLLQSISCNFGDEVLQLKINIPKNVTNIEQYKQNICEKIAEDQGR